MPKIKISMKHRNFKKFLCGLGSLRETIWFPSWGDSPLRRTPEGRSPLWKVSAEADSLLLVALMAFCLNFLMLPVAQSHGDHADHGGLEHMIFWARVVITGGLGIVITVLVLAFVMRRRTKKDK